MMTKQREPVAVGYRRISKERSDGGLGLAAQATAIRTEAQRRGLQLVATFTDNGVSGGAPVERRVELLAALSALEPGDVLLVARRDRIARDTMLAGWVGKEAARRGASIVSAAGEGNGHDPASVLMRQIVDSFSEYERALIRARTKAALAALRAKGLKVSGHAPFGHRETDDGRWVQDKHEQAGIRLACKLRTQGRSLRDIGTVLARRGFLGRAGQTLSAKTVRKILSREEKLDATG